MITNVSVDAHSPEFHDPTNYRSIVGSLQYLCSTRPDLCYTANTVCQIMQRPLECYYQLLKRILRYIKGSVR